MRIKSGNVDTAVILFSRTTWWWGILSGCYLKTVDSPSGHKHLPAFFHALPVYRRPRSTWKRSKLPCKHLQCCQHPEKRKWTNAWGPAIEYSEYGWNKQKKKITVFEANSWGKFITIELSKNCKWQTFIPKIREKETINRNERLDWSYVIKIKMHLDIWRSKWWQVPPRFHFPVLHLQLGLWSGREAESWSFPRNNTHSAQKKERFYDEDFPLKKKNVSDVCGRMLFDDYIRLHGEKWKGIRQAEQAL